MLITFAQILINVSILTIKVNALKKSMIKVSIEKKNKYLILKSYSFIDELEFRMIQSAVAYGGSLYRLRKSLFK